MIAADRRDDQDNAAIVLVLVFFFFNMQILHIKGLGIFIRLDIFQMKIFNQDPCFE